MQTQVRRKPAIIRLSVDELEQLHYCTRFHHICQLNLVSREEKRNRFHRNVFQYIKQEMKKGELIELVKEKLDVIYQEEEIRTLYDCDAQYMDDVSQKKGQYIRIMEYVYQNYKIVEIDKNYHIPEKLQYNGFSFSLDIWVDFILEKNGQLLWVAVEEGRPKFSSLARKFKSRPEQSIKLKSMFLAASCEKKPVNVALWYLANKNDKDNELLEFENRLGSNIVTASFAGTREYLLNQIEEYLNLEEERDCKNCNYDFLCSRQLSIMSEPTTSLELKKEKGDVTKEQRQVISHTEGPLCCIAIPGSGKTFCLVERAKALIESGIKPEEILLISFTQKAAEEISSRIANSLPEGSKLPTVKTFNAFGFGILKEQHKKIGAVRLATETDSLAIMKAALSQCPRIKRELYYDMCGEYGLVRKLCLMKNELMEWGTERFKQYYGNSKKKDIEGIFTVFNKYDALYASGHYIDFDSQISLVNELFDNHPEIASLYAEKYSYIMADEFQDVNEEQAEMLYSIARHHGNIMVVGDDDQSIYGWRGGSKEFLCEFKKDFPAAKVVKLTENFRSTKEILSVANMVISENSQRIKKVLKGHKNGTKPVYLSRCNEEYIEVIVRTALAYGIKPGEIAILARTNEQLEQVQNILRNTVKVTMPKDYLTEDPVFLAVYDVLNLYKNRDEEVSLYRIVQLLGNIDLLKKAQKADTLWDSLRSVDGSLYNKLEKCFQIIEKEPLVKNAVSQILNILFGFSEHKVLTCISDMAEIRQIRKLTTLYPVLKNMIMFHSMDRVGYSGREDAVNLITCHDSKGREFNTVIIFKVEEFNDTEEEIRLLFVAMTRAIRNLYLIDTGARDSTSLIDKLGNNIILREMYVE